NAGRAGEFEDGVVDARRLHDAAVHGDIALEHGQPAIPGEWGFGRTDDAVLAVEVEFGPAVGLGEGLGGAHAAGGGHVEVTYAFRIGAGDIPLVQRIAHSGRMDGVFLAVDEARAVELAENGHDTAGAVHVFHMDVRLGRRDLGEHRHLAAQ